MAYTAVDKSKLHFNTKLYTGDNSTNQAITGVGFQPDLVWMKTRTASAHNHVLIDKVRGVNKLVFTNNTSGNSTNDAYGYLQSFDSDGFTTQKGSDGNAWNVNGSANYVSWNWKAGNSTGSSNSNGSITSTVSANTTAGFSIVSYTGTGSNATIGHGLGTAPGWILIKQLTGSNVDWFGYHKSISPATGFKINSTGNPSNDSSYFNNTAATNTVFSVGNANTVNGNGIEYIAYCWAEKAGYSRFGKYTGNGNADGTFIYTGFKPGFFIFKQTNTTGNWAMIDSTRSYANVGNHTLAANSNGLESAFGGGESVFGGSNKVDILSNGIKIRENSAYNNTSGGSYIFIAFAEQPLVASNNIAATAR